MVQLKQPHSTFARVPAILLGAGIAVFAFYFLFLRTGRAPVAEAATPAPPAVETPAPLPVAVETPEPTPPPQPSRPAPKPEPKAEWQQDVAIERLIEEGKHFDARVEIARVFGAAETTDAMRAELATRAAAVNNRLLVTNPDARDVDFAEIVQGENLVTFSRRFKALHGEYGVVQLVNNIKNVSAIRAGTKLRVPKGTWTLLVDKSLFALYLCYQGAPYKSYRVCVGAKDNTPAAKWTVGTKNPKPDWTAPQDWLDREKEKNPVRYGHPKNPLGDWWLGIDNPNYDGFGIHGTNQPETIGTKASMGCVRMLNADVTELARIVYRGMEVTIVE